MVGRSVNIGDGEGGIKALLMKKSVRELRLVMKEVMVKARSSHAVRMPPRAPAASTQWKLERFGGRKFLALAGDDTERSLVSWMQAIVILRALRVSRTILHLSSSLRPRTFQERRP